MKQAVALLVELARQEPGRLAGALGLGIDAASARAGGSVEGKSVTLVDGHGASAAVQLSKGAVDKTRKGAVAVTAVPPGLALRAHGWRSWGQLAEVLRETDWASARAPAEALCEVASEVQLAVDEAEVAAKAEEAPLRDLARGTAFLPGASRFAIGALQLAGQSGPWPARVRAEARTGGSFRPVVRLSWPLDSGVTGLIELGVGKDRNPQLLALVRRDKARGPSWPKRGTDPRAYVAALGRTVPLALAELRPGGFLSGAAGEALAVGWQPTEGRPDPLLLRHASLHTTLLLRPPAGAGLRFVAPGHAKVRLVSATFLALSHLFSAMVLGSPTAVVYHEG